MCYHCYDLSFTIFSCSCKKLDSKTCENVLCKDNPNFYCKLDKKYQCGCPSCDDVDKWQKGTKNDIEIKLHTTLKMLLSPLRYVQGNQLY